MPLALLVPSAGAVPTGLYFSEYVEGSSNNKALEIHNSTGAAVDLAPRATASDVLQRRHDANLTVALTGTVAAGDVYVWRTRLLGGDPQRGGPGDDGHRLVQRR